MKNTFKELVEYCYNTNNRFNSYEEAAKAYAIHSQRQSTKKYKDSLKEFSKKYQKLARSKRLAENNGYEVYGCYDFQEIKGFLKKKNLWGVQCFNSRGTDPMTVIYAKDGVAILYTEYYDYADIIGLRPCDFKVLEKVFHKVSGF